MSSGSSKNDVPATPTKPTDKQMSLLTIIMQNVQSKPDINWAKVVEQSGLKNEPTAKEMYRQMTKKFGWSNKATPSPAGSAGGAATTSTPTKVRKNTGKVGTKSAKKGGGKKTKEEVVKEEVVEEEDIDDGNPV